MSATPYAFKLEIWWTGCNLFTKEKLTELKEQNVPSSKHLGKVIAMWEACSEAVKNEYNDRACFDILEGPKETKIAKFQLVGSC